MSNALVRRVRDVSRTGWIALALLSLTSLCPAAERGIAVFRDEQGQQVGLYRESHALLIGVSDYSGGWPDLENIPRELDTVQATLEVQGFQVTRQHDPDSRELRRAIEDFISRHGRQRENRLLFFFSGHGHTMEKGYRREMGYLVPADAPHPDRDRNGFLNNAVSMNQVLTWARDIDAKHAMFLFDSCFSGSVFKARNLPGQPPHISRLTDKPVRMFITAGNAGETVPAVSVFAPAFVDALQYRLGDLDKDGFVTGMELGIYLQGKVAKHADQTPQFGKIRDFELSQGDFVFLSGEGGATGQADTAPPAPPVPPLSVELAFWESIKDARDPAYFKAYLSRFPDGQFAALARLRLEAPGEAPSSADAPTGPAPGKVWTEPTTGMAFVWVAKGCFQMGSPGDETGRFGNERRHEACVEDFWLGKHEVTNAQYRRFRAAHDSGNYRGRSLNGDDQPVVNVTWKAAAAYAEWLSKKSEHTFRLPSEAEWEYGSRAGEETARHWGDAPDSACRYANVLDEAWRRQGWYTGGHPHPCDDGHLLTAPVGQFQPNAYGLYDMLGNVWEWTCSAYEAAYGGDDARCAGEAKLRAYRGGSWENGPRYVRAASRERFPPESRKYVLGFRLARMP